MVTIRHPDLHGRFLSRLEAAEDSIRQGRFNAVLDGIVRELSDLAQSPLAEDLEEIPGLRARFDAVWAIASDPQARLLWNGDESS